MVHFVRDPFEAFLDEQKRNRSRFLTTGTGLSMLDRIGPTGLSVKTDRTADYQQI